VRNSICLAGDHVCFQVTSLNQGRNRSECLRIFDHTLQNLRGLSDASSKCRLYRYLYDSCTVQRYLRKSVMYAQFITRIRWAAHHLSIETGRYNKNGDATRYCYVYKDVTEDEFHIILKCSLYNDLRKQYIKPKKNFYIQTRPITMYAKSWTTQTSWCVYVQSCQTKNHHCVTTRCL
jgi:hypothetical protein